MKSTKHRPSHKRSHHSRSSIDDLEEHFKMITDKTIAAVVACEPKPDRVFGEFSELVSFVRSVAFHEGRLLEWGIAAVARCNPDLLILPPDRPMPIVPAAVQLLKKNEWRELQGIRLPSEVHTNKTYTPDLFIANRVSHAGLIIDVKRSLASYAESRLEDLRFRMMAVAAIASSWLSERQGPVLVEVGTAIIDGADLASDHDKGVFRLSEVGDLLEVDDAGSALTRLRDMFSERVQRELKSQCNKVLIADVSRSMPSIDDHDTLEAEATTPSPGLPPDTRPGMAFARNVRIGFARSRSRC
jgi:hypothetical protein